jgi:hypothetical protein
MEKFITSQIMEPQLLNKPLFEIIISEDYNDTESAFIFKAHHTMMDGLTGVYLTWAL